MYYKQGNFGMSALCAEKSLALKEGDSGTYNNLGVMQLQQENEPAAIDKFKTAIKLDPDNFEANTNLGFVALDSGDYKLALDSFIRASAANPSSVDAKIGLAVAYRGLKEYDKAGALYDEIIKADKQNEVAYFNAAILHEKYTKDYARALKYLEQYVDVKSGQIGPNHEVFARMDGVKKSQEAERKRKEELERIEREKKEREERAMATLKELEGMVAGIKGKLAGCPEEVKMEVEMMIEQATTVIETKDTAMATDVKSMFTDYYGPMVDTCAGAAAPAPEETAGGTPAPAEGTPAPAPEGTPAPTPPPTPAPDGTPAPTPAPPG
jgi:Flp pilus assembly protein TadD